MQAQSKYRSAPTAQQHPVRIDRIAITDYKAIDQLEIAFPLPDTVDQPDVFVLGSKNGVGKSSVLECCAIAMLGSLNYNNLPIHHLLAPHGSRLHVGLIRSGAAKAHIRTALRERATTFPGEVSIEEHLVKQQLVRPATLLGKRRELPDGVPSARGLLANIIGIDSDPLLLPPVLLFHSYRKVTEGSAALGNMLSPSSPSSPQSEENHLSRFKLILIQALMAKSGLFEGVDSAEESERVIDKLNGLIRDFAGGTVDRLRPGPAGTLELRVAPINGEPSFSFDGLSSGQKEIITTLFLIWHLTQEQPGVVLIDEPELHLNAEWQRLFVHKLAELAPSNQYILATHSEEVFASVAEDRRLLLAPE